MQLVSNGGSTGCSRVVVNNMSHLMPFWSQYELVECTDVTPTRPEAPDVSFWETGNNSDQTAAAGLHPILCCPKYANVRGQQVGGAAFRNIKHTHPGACLAQRALLAPNTPAGLKRAALQAVGKSNMGATIIQRCHFLQQLRLFARSAGLIVHRKEQRSIGNTSNQQEVIFM